MHVLDDWRIGAIKLSQPNHVRIRGLGDVHSAKLTFICGVGHKARKFLWSACTYTNWRHLLCIKYSRDRERTHAQYAKDASTVSVSASARATHRRWEGGRGGGGLYERYTIAEWFTR